MLISRAYAASAEAISALEGEIPPLPEAASAGELLFTNLMVVAALVLLFYVLLIMPQQRRFREHSKMLNELKKGDAVITGGGLIGKVDKVIPERDEVVIDLGEVKVTALRSTIHQKDDPRLRLKPANDANKDKEKDKSKEKTDKTKDA
jgi:preprotein translocase subunit YajC